MKFTDAVAIAGTRRTNDGYLVAEAKSVRTGIQLYLGDEVGKPEMAMVRVYRAPEEVFSKDALQSFSHAPVTLDHPAEAVTSENWKRLSVGEVSTAALPDGQWVMLPLILKDADAIAAVDGGKRELSAGYSCDLDWTPGTTADGQPYDAQQKNIKINHLAIVDRGRAGSQARIGDAGTWGASPVSNLSPSEKERPMTLKTVTVDGIPIEVTDQGATVIATLQARLADATSKHNTDIAGKDKDIATKDAELAKKDAEIDALKAKVVDGAALDKLVADRAGLIAVATKIAKDVKVDGLSDAAIRRAVVTAKLGDAALAGKPDAYIDARFDILAEDAQKAAGSDPFARVLSDGVKPADTAPASTAHNAMVTDMASAWMTQNKGAA